MSKIHDIHGVLSSDQRADLDNNADNQEMFILQYLNKNRHKRFAYFEIKNATGWDKDSVKRSLSNLSGSGSPEYTDAAGRWPVEYDSDKRKKNPATGKSCGTYGINPHYGDPSGQNEMFGAPKAKFRQGLTL